MYRSDCLLTWLATGTLTLVAAAACSDIENNHPGDTTSSTSGGSTASTTGSSATASNTTGGNTTASTANTTASTTGSTTATTTGTTANTTGSTTATTTSGNTTASTASTTASTTGNTTSGNTTATTTGTTASTTGSTTATTTNTTGSTTATTTTGTTGTTTTGTTGSTTTTTGVTGRTCAIAPPPGAAAADVISDFEEGYGVMIKQGGRTGYWAPYNNSADPQNQTPAKPATGMGDKIAVEPTGACMMSAFHSSAMGQDNYVGFGAQFHPNMPLTTSNVADAYDVSAYDGITFRAKTGGGPTAQPVFVEILTKETQPSTAGGVATNQATDLYNNRGYMANIASTSYTQFFVPFGALIPRSIPAQGAGGNACPATGTLLCQAPKFVPASALGIQFSWYGPMDTPGFLTPNPVGSYNVFIDDVAFYKRSALPAGMSDLPALPSSGGAHPLQENASINARCGKPTGANGKLLALAYDNWKKRFVVADSGGFKIIRPENGNDTVSEGIAYGMMIAVYFDDKALFDGLYTYWKAHVASNGLMTWCIPAGGGSCSASGGTATDADEDAAFAMLMASKQWPSGGYGGTATTLISAVFTTDMSGTYIKAGSNYSATQITNPSYFAPAFYRVFAAADSGHGWAALADNSYTLLNAALQGRSNGLVPAWCTGGSCNAPASNGGTNDMIYQYDSHRVPWRVGLDYCWNGTAAAKTYLDKISAFFSGKATNGTGRVFDIYSLTGTETTDAAVNSGSAIGTAASGAMSNASYSAFMNNGYQLVLDLLNRGEIGDRVATAMSTKSGYSYFNSTVGLLVLLTMSGNFQAW